MQYREATAMNAAYMQAITEVFLGSEMEEDEAIAMIGWTIDRAQQNFEALLRGEELDETDISSAFSLATERGTQLSDVISAVVQRAFTATQKEETK